MKRPFQPAGMLFGLSILLEQNSKVVRHDKMIDQVPRVFGSLSHVEYLSCFAGVVEFCNNALVVANDRIKEKKTK